MMVLGAYVALTRFHAGLMNPPPGIPAGVLLAVALATIVVFPVLFGSALLLRRRVDYHKRLVLIATLELVTAAVARWPGVAPLGPPGFRHHGLFSSRSSSTTSRRADGSTPQRFGADCS